MVVLWNQPLGECILWNTQKDLNVRAVKAEMQIIYFQAAFDLLLRFCTDTWYDAVAWSSSAFCIFLIYVRQETSHNHGLSEWDALKIKKTLIIRVRWHLCNFLDLMPTVDQRYRGPHRLQWCCSITLTKYLYMWMILCVQLFLIEKCFVCLWMSVCVCVTTFVCVCDLT